MQPARNIASTSELSNDSGCRVNGVDLGTMNRRDDVPSASAGEKRTVVDEDVERIESFLSGHVIETGFQATRAVVTAVVIMIISWQLALISLALGAASFGLARWLSRRMRANAEVRWPGTTSMSTGCMSASRDSGSSARWRRRHARSRSFKS